MSTCVLMIRGEAGTHSNLAARQTLRQACLCMLVSGWCDIRCGRPDQRRILQSRSQLPLVCQAAAHCAPPAAAQGAPPCRSAPALLLISPLAAPPRPLFIPPLSGTMRVILKPLLPEIPGFGAAVVSLRKPPIVRFHLDFGKSLGGSYSAGAIKVRTRGCWRWRLSSRTGCPASAWAAATGRGAQSNCGAAQRMRCGS